LPIRFHWLASSWFTQGSAPTLRH